MILLVPDKFKGTFSASQIAAKLEEVIRATGNTAEEIVSMPMADGGEGSLDVFLHANPASREIMVYTKDALMRDISAPMAVCGDTVFIEMARCCGLMMIDQSERNPLNTTTYGLGLMLLAALDYQPRQIIVGLGGSATNDGGRGLVEAIGLENIHRFDNIRIRVACDVKNPLLGPEGATAVFAPQKGADADMLPVLEKRMEDWCVTARGWLRGLGRENRLDFDTHPGCGAAGGTSAALYAFLNASLEGGFNLFADMVSLESLIEQSRLVITGEGCLDESSMNGKLVGSLAELCGEHCRRLYVVCGRNRLGGHESICDLSLLATGLEEHIAAWCRPDWRSEYLPSEGSLFDFGSSYGIIAGCDEAGRGPLAGPVYAAAVVLPEGFYHPLLKDSKKMTAAQRETMCAIIEQRAVAWSVASVSAAEIDEINILQASIKAMQLALDGLYAKKPGLRIDLALIDGNRFSPYYAPGGARVPHKCIVKGDDKVPEISAASILAKTCRDRYMMELDKEYPQYGWASNMGYPTQEHRDAIHRHGLTPHHRKSFTVK